MKRGTVTGKRQGIEGTKRKLGRSPRLRWSNGRHLRSAKDGRRKILCLGGAVMPDCRENLAGKTLLRRVSDGCYRRQGEGRHTDEAPEYQR